MPTLNLGRVRFNWKGDYNPAASYLEYDVVKDDGQSYVAIQDVADTDPGPNETGGDAFWEGVLLRGADYNDARDQAVQAASDASDSATASSDSASAAGDSAGAASESQGLAEKFANEDEDVEVEPGLFSAFHWAQKAAQTGDPNEMLVTADETSDTRALKEWTAALLVNQQSVSDNEQSLIDHEAATDPHTQYTRKSQNLADLADSATARSNLGLGTVSSGIPVALFAPGTVVQMRSATSGAYSTSSTTDFPMGDALIVTPKRSDTSLVVYCTYAFEVSRTNKNSGGHFMLKRYDGANYVDIAGALALELTALGGGSATSSILRGSGALSTVLTQAQLRSDTGTWTVRLYGRDNYGDQDASTGVSRSRLIVMEVVN